MGDQYLGEIRMIGFNFAPSGWMLCNGQLLGIAQNTALFSLLGTTYGGDGVTNFQLPDFQCRFPAHAGNGSGLGSMTLGQKSGTQNATIGIGNLPAHTHVATLVGGSTTPGVTVEGSSAPATSSTPTGNYLSGSYEAAPTRTGALYAANPARSTLGNIAGVTATGIPTGVTVAPTGNSQPLPVQNPYLAVYFIIALQGIYPSRG